ncbi:MAG: very short patch repair endonuclease [bacterium]
MTDNISKSKRSEIMRAVKDRDSEIETAFRKALWHKGFRYRKNSTKYFAKPDIMLKKHKTVIFIDSCFWHGCKAHCRMPETSQEYWVGKIKRNRERDQEVNNYYKKLGWNLFRVWEHEISNKIGIEKKLSEIIGSLV